VLGAARPLADVLWMRETEAGGFDTPERRAALEARIGEVTATIGEEAVRRYYRQDFSARLRSLLQPAQPQARRAASSEWRMANSEWRTGNRKPGYSPFATRYSPSPRHATSAAPYVVASPQLAASPLHRGHRAAIPRREALILQAVLNHPWLLHEHLEDLAGVEFRHAEAGKLKSALIDVFAHDGAPDRDAMRAALAGRGLADLAARIENSITTQSVWGARAEAAPDDVLQTWKQLVALHRQWHSLVKELRDAEQALGRESTEANYSWLQDVKARLSVIDGTEALIEGFGASSGRAAQTL